MGGSLGKPIILTVLIYLFLKFIVPNIPGSAPLPSSLIFLYLILTISGIVIFATLSGESKDAFWGPIQRFLTGENIGGLQMLRYGVLILFPLLVGWQTYTSTAPSDQPPAENRTIHPAPPGARYAMVRVHLRDISGSRSSPGPGRGAVRVRGVPVGATPAGLGDWPS